jgi:hypothetical protein
MNDNLKALAFEEALDGENGQRAAEAGRFFEQGGVFDSTQRGFHSTLATGSEVREGLGGVAGDLVATAQGEAYSAAANGINVAANVNNEARSLGGQLPGLAENVQGLKGGVDALPGAGIINEGAARPMIADVVKASGFQTSKESVEGVKNMFGSFSAGLPAGVGDLGKKLNEALDAQVHKPDQIDAMEQSASSKVPSSSK